MIDRITKNEERFDKILLNVKELQKNLETFEQNQKDLLLLKKYYQSKTWIKDKDNYEKNVIPKVKAGVLSEDGIWNMLSDLDELIIDMKRIIKKYESSK